MDGMKVAALIPFRNEARILPSCMASLKGVADVIIGMDDGSEDGSGDIVRAAGGLVLSTKNAVSGFSQGKEKAMRQSLLEEARGLGCTHFFAIDGDEAVTAPFRRWGRELMARLEPGQKLAIPWLTLWGSSRWYRDGDYSKFHRICRGLVVRDSPDLPDYYGFLHMPRLPGSDRRDNVLRCPLEKGAVLHFTAEELLPYQLKIAWYFCIELVRTPDEAERINRFYFRDCDETYVKLRHVPDAWVEGLPLGDMRPSSPSWRIAEMGRLFDEYGVQFFEPLEIWHIPALREEFVRRTGREPEGPSLSTRVRRAVRMQRKRFDRWVVDMARALRNQPY